MDYGLRFGRDRRARLPELYLAVRTTFLLVWGARVSTGVGGPVLREGRNGLSLLVLGLTGLLLAQGYRGEGGIGGSLLNGAMVRDGRGVGLQGLVVRATRLSLGARRGHLREVARDAFEYPLLRLLAVLGRFLLLGASDLLRLYLGLELQSLCLYVLAAFRRGSAYATEAGLKYFMLGALASGLLLFGASLLYGYLGTTQYSDRSRLLAAGREGRARAPLAGAGRVARGLLFKLAAAPFHAWSPDVLEGAPISSSRFLAAVTKMAALGALVRFLYRGCYGRRGELLPLLVVVSALSRRVAALGALRQRRLKRFLGYSAMGHVGYLLVGLACGTREGLQGVFLYVILYVVGSLTVWTGLRSLRSAGGASRPAVYLTDLGNLNRIQPALARALAVGRFSRAGIPPRAGFYAKLGVFFGAREAGLYGLALVGVLASVVGAFYYLRWMKIRYFEGGSVGTGVLSAGVKPVDRGAAWVRARGVFVRLFFRVHPAPLLRLTHQWALALCV